jgi:YVTN family beta-propeller protein
MRRGRAADLSLILSALLLAVFPSLAAGRSAYVTGSSSEAAPYAVPVDLVSQTPGTEVPLPGGGEGAPPDVAITPDGAGAYVSNLASGEVVPIDVAANTAGTPISVPSPYGVAITADGSRVYVSDQGGNVYAIDVATNAVVVGPIAVGSGARAIAVTPDGALLYVANAFDDTVSVIDTATNLVIATIAVGNDPEGIAVTPDGAFVYVANSFSDDVSVIDVKTNSVVATVSTSGGNAIAVTPNGATAYSVAGDGSATPIDVATNVAGPSIPVGDFLSDIAILPNGATGYAVSSGNLSSGLVPIDPATNTAGGLFSIGDNPEALAIVPNQPPHASFAHAPEPGTAGSGVSFDASSSTDSDGSVARYDWDFGDGATAPDGGATPSHTYAAAGTYTVTLTLTDDEGCSTQIVFTGQTAYCNGSALARTTRTVTVAAGDKKTRCPKIAGKAHTFVPKIVPGHVVPGVRVRLSGNQPLLLKVTATLLWSKNGAKHQTSLGRHTAKIEHWRRIRFPLPPSLRDILPIGHRVRVKLRIAASPLRHSKACAGRTITKTLRVRVKRVFPNAIQRGRVR